MKVPGSHLGTMLQAVDPHPPHPLRSVVATSTEGLCWEPPSLLPRRYQAISALSVIHVSVRVDSDRGCASSGRDQPSKNLLGQRPVAGPFVLPVRAPAATWYGGYHLVGLLQVGKIWVVRHGAASTAFGVDDKCHARRLVPGVHVRCSTDRRLRAGEDCEPACPVEVPHAVIVHDRGRPRRGSAHFGVLAGHQLGKLRSLWGRLGADLGERLVSGPSQHARVHRDSPLFPARSGALVVRSCSTLPVRSEAAQQYTCHSFIGIVPSQASQTMSAHSRATKTGRLRTTSPTRWARRTTPRASVPRSPNCEYLMASSSPWALMWSLNSSSSLEGTCPTKLRCPNVICGPWRASTATPARPPAAERYVVNGRAKEFGSLNVIQSPGVSNFGPASSVTATDQRLGRDSFRTAAAPRRQEARTATAVSRSPPATHAPSYDRLRFVRCQLAAPYPGFLQSSDVQASNCGGGELSGVQGGSPAFIGGSSRGWGLLQVSAER
ncbi:hypothetical protein RKD27_005288 [Streptomyces sp. SAI-126]